MCLDTRDLNALLVDVKYSLPLIKDIFNKISGFKIACRLDLADSFNQLPICENDRQKTTFSFNGKRYIFNGAPFGVKILTAHLQRTLSKLLEDFSGFVAIFVDDIVVFSQDEDQHVHHLNLVIDALNVANLKLREEKCLFGCTKLTILGHIVSGNTIRADPHKLSAFQKLDVPTTVNNLKVFLVLLAICVTTFRCSRVLLHHRRIHKTKGSLASVWTGECEAFATVKKYSVPRSTLCQTWRQFKIAIFGKKRLRKLPIEKLAINQFCHQFKRFPHGNY